MVSNDRYELGRAEGFGSRRRIDAGTLGIVAARFQSSDDAAKFAQLHASGRTRRSGSGSSLERSGFGSRATPRATRPPPLCQPRGWATALLQTAAGRPVTIEP